MRIRVDAAPIGPLKVLPELPDARLAILEGLNGIGKTLAVRLLQICTTGTSPYRVESPAWPSLCEGLGEFTVEISGLRDGHIIEWAADTRTWADKTDVSDSFTRLLIDGRPSTLADVRQLLVVHRLAGDETLIETLAQQADDAESVVSRWRAAVTADEKGPVGRLESLGDTVLQLLGDWDLARYKQLLHDVRLAENDVADATTAMNAATTTLDGFREAMKLQKRLNQLQCVAPELKRLVDEVDRQIEKKRAELDQLQDQITARARLAARALPAVRELKNARKTLDRNHKRLSRAMSAASAEAAGLGLKPTRATLSKEETSISKRIDELKARQIEMDAAPAMRTLLDQLSDVLVDGEGRGLASEIALDDPETDLQLTVNQTRIGIGTRRVQLEGQPPAPEARKVLGNLQDANTRLERVLGALGHLESVDRYRRLVASNEERVDRALSTMAPRAHAELQALEQGRRAVDATMLKLAADRATLRQQLSLLGGDRPDVLESRLKSLLNQLNVTPDALPNAVADGEERVQTVRSSLDRTRERVLGLKRDTARAAADVKRATHHLSPQGGLDWLSEALELSGNLDDTAPSERQLEVIDRARERIAAVVGRLGDHRNQLGAVAQALRGIGRLLRGHDPEASEYLPELTRWFEAQFSEWFSSSELRHELLPDSDGDIQVDVARREVRWQTGGHDRSRPLEAFSSGEQAFAYTRARIASLDHEIARAPNRLIVLDEFGAFIAADRLSVLTSYLRERATDHPDDQVLIVLPLSQDYATEAGRSLTGKKEKLDDLARQIESRQFAVQKIA